MLPSERHAIILREVERQPAVSIRFLTEKLGVSRETVRKDIEVLAEAGELNQVRGGATSLRKHEPPMADRSQTNPDGKKKIGLRIAQLIPDGASIIIDSGSTTLAAAHELAHVRNDLSIYTNDLNVALVLAPKADVTLLGGRFNAAENATMGLDTLDHLSRFHADFSLVGTGGICERALFTDFSLEAANLRHLMMERAQRPLILADHSKFGVVGQVGMKPLPASVSVVVDKRPTGKLAEALAQQGVGIILA
ncbi:Glycerol-3-phosphate regulon repressor [Aliiroseovarius sp. xm-m-379]|uniref:DeoR/GlpR family DNA-binding transcription regulator n=1 Tax=unclassified Aliiroseovarius TaxID=2623558 RepID=UPI00156A1BFB|nr:MULTISPECIES: DeoR/GlpR family DNA-binding transcription regulator [unclassified Aliiroseovarius]NRP13083.1 Glycerol-3-phosphate regulon repressor [Aliiroseovarius sp. xm-d-517]NRP24084.1 Glycerol-3-phosphate regulon repressor [Aliiroseovarius sp. xm-m-379]NRP30105.1 Glycerol-3-phosphate regulon repressor [Aliiroseovarius sp. xm-m-314]NRP32883.1 Glycerol-3-phosphate regulon repressor [Aliiroseovarius sp. xm-a-104]NRP40442.1 Glycerol-3-phosphate regulon repressor [Aliiroseovarius sp. xm-m-33